MAYLTCPPCAKDLQRCGGKDGSRYGKEEEKAIIRFLAPTYFLLLIYSIFLPLKPGTIWLYVGIAIYLLGLTILTLLFKAVAATPAGEPFTKEPYRYSRHPMYLGVFLVFIDVGIASASWLYSFLSFVLLVSTHFVIVIEERHCLEKYGDAYRDYVESTPRWIRIPKSGSSRQA